MAHRVLLKDIARATGVSVSTVSVALRNSPLASAATRRRVQRAAQKLGYRPDPALAAFGARLRAGHTESSAVLALIIHKAEDQKPGPWDSGELLSQAASKRGYLLRVFDPAQFRCDEELSDVLFNRGVRGVIIMARGPAPRVPGLQWDRFSVVSCDWPSPHLSPFHHVSSDSFHSVVMAYERVCDLGYRRIGLAPLSHSFPNWGDLRRLGAAHALLKSAPFPPLPFILDSVMSDAEALSQWIRRHKPDAVITLLNRSLHALRQAGYRVPEDLGYACLIGADPETCSGLRFSVESMAEATIDILDSQIRHGQRGMPEAPYTIFVEPEWIDGPTLLRRPSPPLATGRLSAADLAASGIVNNPCESTITAGAMKEN